MEKKKDEWTITATARRFHCEFFEVIEDEVIKPDGEPGCYATVRMKPGVNILPFDDMGNVYLTKQYRYAIERDCLEVTAGGQEEGESPLESAKREAKEELGIEAEEWTDLGSVDVDTSIVNSQAHQFLARQLKFKEPEQESTENIKTVKMKLSEALEKVMNGDITHAPSGVLIMKAHHFLQNNKSDREK
jgi:8-oxo-dGTP pyrophosphatase MutT (NUDIX family)